MDGKVPAPESLDDAGRALWETITGKYELRADELVTLEDVCAATDLIAMLDREWRMAGRPVTSTGSMGQEVEHPLIGSIDKQRKMRNLLWRQLKLPDAEGAERPNQQRQAAQSRWAAAHGRSA